MTKQQNQNFLSLERIFKALGYSLDGLRHTTANEAAFQQELIVIVILTLICIVLPFELFLKVLILIAHLLVLVVELLNTAIEAVADRLCRDADPLIKQAKDAGSAAVLLTFAAGCLLWGYSIYTLL